MRKRIGAIGIVVLLMGGMTIAVRGARDKPVESAENPAKVKLEAAALTAPQAVLCRPQHKQFSMFNGIVLAGEFVQLGVQASQTDRMLGGSKLEFSIVEGKDIRLTHSGASVMLRKKGSSFEPVTLKLAEDRPYVLTFAYGYVYASPARVGQAQEVRGFLLPRSGEVRRFTLDGQSFGLYDANTDGFYRLGQDAIGAGPTDKPYNVFAPLAKRVGTRSGVYQLVNLAETGSELAYAPYAGETARVSIGLAEADLAIQGAFVSSDAEMSFVASASADGSSDVVVVPGQYNLQYGLVYAAKTKQLVASVWPGNLAVEAKAEQPLAVTLGGPFAMDFQVRKSGSQMVIDSSTFHLRGKSGEEYANFTWAAEPQISLVSNGKTTPIGKMEFG